MDETDNETNQYSNMDRYGYSIPDRKIQNSLFPIINDSLAQFMEHHQVQCRDTENTSYTHVRWHTHKSAGNCFICDLIVQNSIKQDVIFDIIKIDPKRYTFKENKQGTIQLTKG